MSSRRSDGSFPSLHSSSASSVSSSQVSISSSYRHHHSDLIPTPSKAPQPMLLQDEKHAPKTRGSLGILIVGLTGARGATLAAGLLANRSQLEWNGPKGEQRQATYRACRTQQQQEGGEPQEFHFNLADANLASIGGWVSLMSNVCSCLFIYIFIHIIVFICTINNFFFSCNAMRISTRFVLFTGCSTHQTWRRHVGGTTIGLRFATSTS
jgi:hypothetical protein